MNKATLEKYNQLKIVWFFLFVIIITTRGYGQTSLYSTNFGTTTTLPTGWTSSNTTNGWAGSTASASTGYTGVSGGANVVFNGTGTNGLTHTLTYSNSLSTVGYTNITVLWAGRGTATFTPAVIFQWSSDGTTWNNVTYTNVTYNATWALVNGGTRITLPSGTEGISNLRFRFSSTTTNSGNFRIDDFSVEGTPSGSTITVSTTTLTGFTYFVGSGPSAEQTFTCSGSNLTADITLAAPANYEISTTSGIGFTNSITLTQTAGTVSLTTIYVRLISGLAVGIYNLETITASSTGATDRTVICNGEVVPNGFVINEIMVRPNSVNDGTNAPNTAEWIEFYNGTGSAIDISCWFFTDGDFSVTFPSGTIVAAGGYITVASAAGSGLSPTIDWATCGCSAGGAQVGIFTNGGEQVLLYNSSGTLIDAVIWSGGQLPDGMTTSTVGSCSSVTVTFPSAGSSYEDIGLIGSGVSNERDSDGSSTWQQTTTNTFGYSNTTPLPIELLAFTATLNNKTVDLFWQTATEINNDFFTIERSKDGEHFAPIKTADGAGNSSSLINYNNQDNQPLDGISYYRLKQTDFDGNFSYSNIVSVNFNSKGNIVESIFPNPAQNEITISLNNDQACTVSIYNMLGELVFQKQFNGNNIHINVQDIAKGVYSIAISDIDKTELLKFIKQ